MEKIREELQAGNVSISVGYYTNPYNASNDAINVNISYPQGNISGMLVSSQEYEEEDEDEKAEDEYGETNDLD